MADNLVVVNDVDKLDFSKICRLCLSDKGPMLSLSEQVQLAPNCDALRRSDKVYYSVSIKNPQKTDLPGQICQTCDILINDIYSFKWACKVADGELLAMSKRNQLFYKQTRTAEQKSQTTENYSIKLTTDRLLVRIDDEFVGGGGPTPATKESTKLEWVMLGDSPFVGEQENEDEEKDPLAIGPEDLKHVKAEPSSVAGSLPVAQGSKDVRQVDADRPTTTKSYSYKYRVFCKGSVNRTPIISETASTSRESDIDLSRATRREDVTLDNVFSLGDADKLLDFDNRLVPCVNVDETSETDVDATKPPGSKSSCNDRNETDPDKAFEMLYYDTRYVPDKDLVQGGCPPKRKRARSRSPTLRYSTKTVAKLKPKPGVPRYTYSRRCPGPATSQPNQPTPSQPNTNRKASATDQPTPSQPNTNRKAPFTHQPKPSQPDISVNVSSNSVNPAPILSPLEPAPINPARICIECDLMFETYSDLVTHIETHNAVVEVVSCDQCDKTFKSKVLLASHVYMRHKNPSDKCLLCDICGKVFENTALLSAHVNKHLGTRDYLCDTCGAGFYNRYGLAQHIRQKHLETVRPKKLKCPQCSSEVSSRTSLRRHLLLHTEGPTVECPLCPKLFATKTQVERHMRSHTGETPFVCEVCHRGFTMKWNYTQHMRLHTKIKPYVCQVCGEAFTHNVSRRTHMKKHGGDREDSQEVSRRFKPIARIPSNPPADVP